MNNRIRLSLMLAPACLLTAWANSVIDVVTDNNYRLRGEIISYGKQGIVIKHPAMRQNAVILPSGIRALYFTGTASHRGSSALRAARPLERKSRNTSLRAA